MKPAVFLDRDGVIVELVENPATGEYGPPLEPEDLALVPGAIPALLELQSAGFMLFLVSNQPDYAKGKAALRQIQDLHEAFDRILKANAVRFRHYYYCYHHPQGIVPGYSVACECRKPRPGSILAAERDYDIALSASWMIGDRDTDIACGKAAGVRTILIDNPRSAGYRGTSIPDFRSENIHDAARVILLEKKKTDDRERTP